MFQTCDLDQTLCFTVCGSGKTGKTNFLKYTALQMKKKGAEVYVFDGCLKELEEFSRKNELDGYMTGKEELYHFMENVLLLQLGAVSYTHLCPKEDLEAYPLSVLVLMRCMFNWRKIPEMLKLKEFLIQAIDRHKEIPEEERGNLLGECRCV